MEAHTESIHGDYTAVHLSGSALPEVLNEDAAALSGVLAANDNRSRQSEQVQ